MLFLCKFPLGIRVVKSALDDVDDAVCNDGLRLRSGKPLRFGVLDCLAHTNDGTILYARSDDFLDRLLLPSTYPVEGFLLFNAVTILVHPGALAPNKGIDPCLGLPKYVLDLPGIVVGLLSTAVATPAPALANQGIQFCLAYSPLRLSVRGSVLLTLDQLSTDGITGFRNRGTIDFGYTARHVFRDRVAPELMSVGHPVLGKFQHGFLANLPHLVLLARLGFNPFGLEHVPHVAQLETEQERGIRKEQRPAHIFQQIQAVKGAEEFIGILAIHALLAVSVEVNLYIPRPHVLHVLGGAMDIEVDHGLLLGHLEQWMIGGGWHQLILHDTVLDYRCLVNLVPLLVKAERDHFAQLDLPDVIHVLLDVVGHPLLVYELRLGFIHFLDEPVQH